MCFDMAKNDFQKIALSSVLIRMESYSSGGSAIRGSGSGSSVSSWMGHA